MADAGADVREITLSEPFGRLAEAQALIMDFEAARSTAFELLNHHDKLSKKFLERADAGAAYTVDEYDAARALVMACQGDLDEEMKRLSVLVCPSAPGAAPKGLDATGDPVFNRIWTTLGTPCVSVPGLTGHKTGCRSESRSLGASWMTREPFLQPHGYRMFWRKTFPHSSISVPASRNFPSV